MNTLLKDKNILIMGVANKWSIAWGVAEELNKAGANLAFTYQGERSLANIEKLTKDMKKVKIIECDVTQDEDIKNAFDELKGEFDVLHGVVHCIAHANKEELVGKYMDTSREGYHMAQDISAYSLVAVTKYATELMVEGGSIVTLSYLGAERAIKNYNVMGVAKAALEASTRYLAADLGKENIRVNAISAGPIKTVSAKGVSDFSKLMQAFEERVPLGRVVDAREVGGTAVFLCSNLSSGITGEVIHVDGGFSIVG